MKIYLAGKISKNDWRHSLVPGIIRTEANIYTYGSGVEGYVLPRQWPVMPKAIFGEHDYTGPYFIPCDHGCLHGRNDHGNGANAEMSMCGPVYPIEGDTTGHGPEVHLVRRDVIRLCLSAIIKADVVFVWMDSTTAYGTLFELGYAVAHNKQVWWGMPFGMYDAEDMWFAQTASASTIHASDATSALKQLLERHAPTITGYVYLLQSGNHYKIGKSKDPDQRLTQISPRTPLPVRILHTIGSDDMSWAEASLHRKYASYRTNGEWFALPESEVRWFTAQTYIKRP